MEFFNKLTDVMELVLTPLGRKALASASFSPAYYAFADGDITYDCRYLNYSGTQNEFINRLTGTDRPKKATFFSQDFGDKTYILGENKLKQSLLGTSQLGVRKFPGYELKLYSGHISGSVTYSTSSYANLRTPKMTVEMRNTYDPVNFDFVSEESFLAEINEINGLFEKENFTIEIFKVEYRPVAHPVRDIIEVLRPLRFNSDESIVSGVLSENIDEHLFDQELNISPEEVAYWFDVSFDERISDTIDFSVITQQNIYLRPEVNKKPDDC